MLTGINHVAILTEDIGRLVRFYREVFDVEEAAVMDDRGLRHCLLRVGPSSVLHAFELPAPAPGPNFLRGRIDHLALNVDSVEDFELFRKRLVAADASTGEVVDFGALISVTYRDPDGLECELCWMKPNATLADARDPWA